ncbi:uncharacterized protein [Typha latifolia]|uniref:uncharacterized protein n=1 Tax=Typha latifolia TaxID=4733 RepID=UPI003C2AF978
MRCLGIWILLVVASVALVLLSLSESSGGDPDLVYVNHGALMPVPVEGVKTIITNRKLKEMKYDMRTRTTSNSAKVNMEDYPPFDPSPNSKASIKAGPIEHGTPLMPYIPQPTPPGPPKHGSP